MILLFLAIFGIASGRVWLVNVGNSANSQAVYSPSQITVDIGDVVNFVWKVDLQSVTSGPSSSGTCTPAALPSPVFNSGVKSSGEQYSLDISAANGFARGNQYGFFSVPSCQVGSQTMYGKITVTASSPDVQVGIAIGLTVGWMFLIVVVIVLAFAFIGRWNYKHLKD